MQLSLLPDPSAKSVPSVVPSYVQDRDEAMRAIVKFAGEKFRQRASQFVLEYLGEQIRAPGEEITDAAEAAGIVPLDQRHFGPVFLALSRSGKIAKAGYCERRKGHGTSGGIIWEIVQ